MKKKITKNYSPHKYFAIRVRARPLATCVCMRSYTYLLVHDCQRTHPPPPRLTRRLTATNSLTDVTGDSVASECFVLLNWQWSNRPATGASSYTGLRYVSFCLLSRMCHPLPCGWWMQASASAYTASQQVRVHRSSSIIDALNWIKRPLRTSSSSIWRSLLATKIHIYTHTHNNNAHSRWCPPT